MNDAERARELERLMRAYGSQLVRLCYVCLRDADLAHDAAQEAFLKAWRALAASTSMIFSAEAASAVLASAGNTSRSPKRAAI